MHWSIRIIRIPVIGLLLLASTGAGAQALEDARGLYEVGKYEACLESLNNMAAFDKDPEFLMLRADCLHKMGEFSMAVEDYDRARLNGYTGADLTLHRGICKTSLGLYDGARADLARYMEQHPDDARAFYWMATIEYLCMDNKASLRYLDEAVYLDSTYAEAYFLRGANYAEQGKKLLALEDFDIAYHLDPTLYRAKLNMAVLMLDMERYRGAIELLTELRLESTEICAEALYYRGEAFFRMHDTEGACQDWSEASGLGDVDATENYRRLCLDRNGRIRFKRRTYGEF